MIELLTTLIVGGFILLIAGAGALVMLAVVGVLAMPLIWIAQVLTNTKNS